MHIDLLTGHLARLGCRFLVGFLPRLGTSELTHGWLFCELMLRIGWKLIRLDISEHCDGPAFAADISEENTIPLTCVAFRGAEMRRQRSL